MLYLLAHMADRAVAVAADQVESVVDLGPLVPVPGTAPEIEGLAALRSRVMTVICARTALGVPGATAASPRAIVTVVDGHHYAVLVDALEDIAPLEVGPLPPGLPLRGRWAEVARGLVVHAEEPVLCIDLRALVPAGPALPGGPPARGTAPFPAGLAA